jgi:hypothetical protein
MEGHVYLIGGLFYADCTGMPRTLDASFKEIAIADHLLLVAATHPGNRSIFHGNPR